MITHAYGLNVIGNIYKKILTCLGFKLTQSDPIHMD
jgi:hypothetical protein